MVMNGVCYTVSVYCSFPAFIPWFVPSGSRPSAARPSAARSLAAQDRQDWTVSKVKLCELYLKFLQVCIWALLVQICEIPVQFEKHIRGVKACQMLQHCTVIYNGDTWFSSLAKLLWLKLYIGQGALSRKKTVGKLSFSCTLESVLHRTIIL